MQQCIIVPICARPIFTAHWGSVGGVHMMFVSHKSLHALYREVQIIYVLHEKECTCHNSYDCMAIILYTLQTLAN